VVLNCCVTETKDTPLQSNISTSLAKVRQTAREAVDLVDEHGVDLSGLNVEIDGTSRNVI
jgi:hypothetical protein